MMQNDRRCMADRMAGFPRHAAFLGMTWLLLLLVLIIGVFHPANLRAALAEPGSVHLPAPSGSEWLVITGYNTATHIDRDPYAMDLVRIDSPTTDTPVLAPFDGRVSRGGNCLTVRDDTLRMLICHAFPLEGLVSGSQVVAGQQIGVVAPDGLAGNNGIAHLHLDLRVEGEHRPFETPFSLEQRSFAGTTVANAYAGERVVSTLRLDPTTPGYLRPGWQLVGWMDDADIEDILRELNGQADALFAFDAATQSYRRYSPGAPETVNTLKELTFGMGIWVHIQTPGGAVWQLPTEERARSVELVTGFNLVAWTGPARPVADAVAEIGSLQSLYVWNPATQTYRVYRPDAPAIVNTLTMIRLGQAAWIQVASPATWIQQ